MSIEKTQGVEIKKSPLGPLNPVYLPVFIGIFIIISILVVTLTGILVVYLAHNEEEEEQGGNGQAEPDFHPSSLLTKDKFSFFVVRPLRKETYENFPLDPGVAEKGFQRSLLAQMWAPLCNVWKVPDALNKFVLTFYGLAQVLGLSKKKRISKEYSSLALLNEELDFFQKREVKISGHIISRKNSSLCGPSPSSSSSSRPLSSLIFLQGKLIQIQIEKEKNTCRFLLQKSFVLPFDYFNNLPTWDETCEKTQDCFHLEQTEILFY